MGNNFCVCQGLTGKENESNIFAGMPINNNNNKQEEKFEKETINTNTTFSKYYTNNRNDTMSIKNGGQSNCNENSIFNNVNNLKTFQIYENNNIITNNKLLSEINKNDPYNKSSGKFNVLIIKDQIENGSNLQESKENDKQSNISSNYNERSFGEKNKQASISNFSMNNFCFEVNKNNIYENNSNKNNIYENNSNKNNIYENISNKNNIYENNSNKNNIYENNSNKNNIYENNNDGNNTKENNRYENSKSENSNKDDNSSENNKDNNINYTEEENNDYLNKSNSNKDYLNNDSNYYNSNQREENRDYNLSLYDEDSEP